MAAGIGKLLDNALHYTPVGGGVTLRVAPQPGGAGATLEIEDGDDGIPENECERVFAPFYRSPFVLERNPGGAGLGLAIVRDIATLHAATLTLAQAASGQGLKVRLAFPPLDASLTEG